MEDFYGFLERSHGLTEVDSVRALGERERESQCPLLYKGATKHLFLIMRYDVGVLVSSEEIVFVHRLRSSHSKFGLTNMSRDRRLYLRLRFI